MTGETIDGIEVKIAAKSVAGGKYVRCEIYSTSAGTWSEVKLNTFGTSEEPNTYGDATDKWNTTWTPTDFTDGNFYLRISSAQEVSSLSVDCVQVRVYSS